uniref:IdtS n=1 Tax=Periglandula ipomoeae TaxID=1037530 RepID=J7FIQ7_9HYPO|nr:IdtS [Periglandula ipomoeae]
MSRSDRLFNLLQVFFGSAGMIWKAREGYPIIDSPGLLQPMDSSEAALSYKNTSTWFGFCMGRSVLSMWDNWPWFSLHCILYIGQLVGFFLIILHETVPHGGPLNKFGTFVALGYLCHILGLSTALPMFSLWVFNSRRATNLVTAWSRRKEKALTIIFWFSGIMHIAVFLVAFTATLIPRDATAPFHIMNSLLGVPDCSQLPCSAVAQRHARLRQINEITGTSSGFFMTVGLFSHALEANNTHLSSRLLTRMFLVSLIAGPAAGGADVLLLRDSFIRSRKHRERRDVQ